MGYTSSPYLGGRKSLPTPTLFCPSKIPVPRPLYSVSCFLRVFELVRGPGLQLPLTGLRARECGLCEPEAGMNSGAKGKGGGQGHLEQASPKNLKLALGTGMFGLQGTTAVKRKHKSRKQSAPHPTPTPLAAHSICPGVPTALNLPPEYLRPSSSGWSVGIPLPPQRCHFPPWRPQNNVA